LDGGGKVWQLPTVEASVPALPNPQHHS